MFRVWSAACSSGEEAYSAAMVLADRLDKVPWEVIGTDLSTRVLKRARKGHYKMERIEGIPKDYLRRFCLKGTGQFEDTLLIDSLIRTRVCFSYANLNRTLPQLGDFDVIFLRNVLIYFNQATKREIVRRVLELFKPDGYLLTGHSDTLKGVQYELEMRAPAIYQKSKIA